MSADSPKQERHRLRSGSTNRLTQMGNSLDPKTACLEVVHCCRTAQVRTSASLRITICWHDGQTGHIQLMEVGDGLGGGQRRCV